MTKCRIYFHFIIGWWHVLHLILRQFRFFFLSSPSALALFDFELAALSDPRPVWVIRISKLPPCCQGNLEKNSKDPRKQGFRNFNWNSVLDHSYTNTTLVLLHFLTVKCYLSIAYFRSVTILWICQLSQSCRTSNIKMYTDPDHFVQLSFESLQKNVSETIKKHDGKTNQDVCVGLFKTMLLYMLVSYICLL